MILIVNKPGQLGNMLLLYSHLIGRAIESNLIVANSAFDDYADLFPSTAGDLLCRFPPKASPIRCTRLRRRLVYHLFHFIARVLSRLRVKLPVVREITLQEWDTEFNLGEPHFLASLKPRQLVLLRGWLFRDSDALLKHAEAVREFFRPLDRHQKNVAAVIERARKDADILVGVHVRHGYLYFANARQYFYPTERYAEIMGEVAALFSGRRLAFLICSDWPQDPELFSGFRVTFGTNELIEDLYAFARCDYLVGPPSTFTGWASFYGNVPLNIINRVDQEQSIGDFQVRSFDRWTHVRGNVQRKTAGILERIGDPARIRVSLVVPVCDEAARVRQLLESIAAQSRQPDEIVFVDCGNLEGKELLRSARVDNPNVRVIEAGKTSRALGRNIGIANARCEWIALTDARNRLDPQWLERLIEVAVSQPDVDIVCGDFEPEIDSFFKECAAIVYVPSSTPITGGSDRGPFFASSLVRREAWKSVGGFADMPAAEDLIFLQELREKGHPLGWAPGATVHWEMSSTLGSTFRRFVLYSSCHAWAKRQRYWHYGVARLYAVAIPFIILAAVHHLWWLVVPVMVLFARTTKNIWQRREGLGVVWVLNPRRLAGVLAITLTIDLATFVGWIGALLNRSESRRISRMLTTMSGE
jgi:GT2 family glycosyltransferase